MIKELAAFRATRAQLDTDATERGAERARARESVQQAELARSEATQREEKLVAEVQALQVLELFSCTYPFHEDPMNVFSLLFDQSAPTVGLTRPATGGKERARRLVECGDGGKTRAVRHLESRRRK